MIRTSTKAWLAASEPDAKAIGKRIARARRARKLTVRSLADGLCLAEQTIHCWECGARIPPYRTMYKLGLYLRRSLDWLSYGTPKGAYPRRHIVRNQTGDCCARE